MLVAYELANFVNVKQSFLLFKSLSQQTFEVGKYTRSPFTYNFSPASKAHAINEIDHPFDNTF